MCSGTGHLPQFLSDRMRTKSTSQEPRTKHLKPGLGKMSFTTSTLVLLHLFSHINLIRSESTPCGSEADHMNHREMHTVRDNTTFEQLVNSSDSSDQSGTGNIYNDTINEEAALERHSPCTILTCQSQLQSMINKTIENQTNYGCFSSHPPYDCVVFQYNRGLLADYLSNMLHMFNSGPYNPLVYILCKRMESGQVFPTDLGGYSVGERVAKRAFDYQKQLFIQVPLIDGSTSTPKCQVTCTGRGWPSVTVLNDKPFKTPELPDSNRSRRSFNDKDWSIKTECEVTFREPLIVMVNCSGLTKVISGQGLMVVTCEQLSKVHYYGPVMIEREYCRSFLQTNSLCDDPAIDEHYLTVNCDGKLATETVWLISFIILLLVLEILTLRIVYVLKYLRIGNYKEVGLAFEGEDIMYKMKRRTPLFTTSVSYKRAAYVHANETEYKHFRFRKSQFLLVILMLARPTECSDQISQAIPHSFHLSESESVVLGRESLTVQEAHTIWSLRQMYHTDRFTYYQDKDWHCRWSECISHGPCGVEGTFGNITSKNMWEADWDAGYRHIYIRYCSIGTHGCFMADGCWKWFVSIRIKVRDHPIVFRPVLIDSRVVTLSTDKFPCKVSSKSLSSGGMDKRYSVIHDPESGWFFCPYDDGFKKPLLNNIGDIQFNAEYAITFDHNLVSCVKSDMYGPSCTLASSAYDTSLTECTKLPAVVGGANYEVVNQQLIVTSKSDAAIELVCDDELPFLKTNESCGGLSYHVSGVTESNMPVLLFARPKHNLKEGMWSGFIPCTSLEVSIPCNSQGYVIEITWPNLCLSEDGSVEVTVMDSQVLSDWKQEFYGTADPDGYFDSVWGSLRNFISHPLGISLLSSPLVFLVLGLLAIRR